jgi:hypothetical protein
MSEGVGLGLTAEIPVMVSGSGSADECRYPRCVLGKASGGGARDGVA